MPDMQYELSPAPTCGHKTFFSFANDPVYAALPNSLLSYLKAELRPGQTMTVADKISL